MTCGRPADRCYAASGHVWTTAIPAYPEECDCNAIGHTIPGEVLIDPPDDNRVEPVWMKYSDVELEQRRDDHVVAFAGELRVKHRRAAVCASATAKDHAEAFNLLRNVAFFRRLAAPRPFLLPFILRPVAPCAAASCAGALQQPGKQCRVPATIARGWHCTGVQLSGDGGQRGYAGPLEAARNRSTLHAKPTQAESLGG